MPMTASSFDLGNTMYRPARYSQRTGKRVGFVMASKYPGSKVRRYTRSGSGLAESLNFPVRA